MQRSAATGTLKSVQHHQPVGIAPAPVQGESDVRVAEQAGQLMEMMDQNGDDKVSKVEFLEHMGFVRGTLNDAEFLQYLTDAFAVKVRCCRDLV